MSLKMYHVYVPGRYQLIQMNFFFVIFLSVLEHIPGYDLKYVTTNSMLFPIKSFIVPSSPY
jgi:hypothetical protein